LGSFIVIKAVPVARDELQQDIETLLWRQRQIVGAVGLLAALPALKPLYDMLHDPILTHSSKTEALCHRH
jgi:hypothetical protein